MYRQFKLGFKVAHLRNQRNEIQNQIEKENEDRSVIANFSRGAAIWNGQSPTERLDSRKAELDEKIMAIDSNAPGGPKVPPPGSSAELMTILSQGFSPDNNSSRFMDKVGAFTGTIIGFGVGHAFQGRYSDSGWKWTLGEIATFSAAANTSDKTCTETTHDPYTGMTQRSCMSNGKSPTIAATTTALWLGLRIWQSYDLWTYNGASTKKSTSVVVLPNSLIWAQEF